MGGGIWGHKAYILCFQMAQELNWMKWNLCVQDRSVCGGGRQAEGVTGRVVQFSG
jgi:hypothetical protein